GFSQIEFAWSGTICGCVRGVSVRDAGRDSCARHSGSTAFLEFLAAPARAFLVPPDLLPDDGSGSSAQRGREVRHLAERQSCAADVDLGLLAQNFTDRTDALPPLDSVGVRCGLPPILRRFLAPSLFLARIGEPVGDIRAVPDVRNGKPFSQDLFATIPIAPLR